MMSALEKQCGNNCDGKSHGNKQMEQFGNLSSVPFESDHHEKSHNRSEDMRGEPFQTDLSKNQEYVEQKIMHKGFGNSLGFGFGSHGKDNSDGNRVSGASVGANMRGYPFKSDIDKNKEHVQEGVIYYGVGGFSDFTGKENSRGNHISEVRTGENMHSCPFKSDIDKNKEHVQEGVMQGSATF